MNSTFKTLSTLAIGSVAAISFAGAASAATLNANIGFSPLGSTTYTGSNLANATSINFANTNLVNTNNPTYQAPGGSLLPNDFYDGNAGGSPQAFAVSLGSTLTLSPDPFTISPTASLPFVVTFTSATGPVTFTSSSFTTSSSGPNALDFAFLGTLTGTGFDPSTASLTFAFTQTGGVGGAVNYSATIASPPNVAPTSTPEPSALLGLGLIGLAGVASRRLKK